MSSVSFDACMEVLRFLSLPLLLSPSRSPCFIPAALSSYFNLPSLQVMAEVRKHFRPELLNRLDEIVVFEPLSLPELRKVSRMQMRQVASRLAERGIALAVTDEALDVILKRSYDPVYGARPLRR